MTPEERDRFEMLKAGPYVSNEYFEAFYGVRLPFNTQFEADAAYWLRYWRGQPLIPNPQDAVHRVAFEFCMRDMGLQARRPLAAVFGLTVESFDAVVGQFTKLGMSSPRYWPYPDLFDASLYADVRRALPTSRFQQQHSLPEEVAAIHAGLSKLLNCRVEAAATCGGFIDCITLDFVEPTQCVWVDFGKPSNYMPDRISKKFYAENRDELRAYLATGHEPADLDDYLLTAAR